jgi:SAM-dependent methyltransferase
MTAVARGRGAAAAGPRSSGARAGRTARRAGRAPRGEEGDLFDLLGARWDRLWYVSPRRTAQEARAVLAAAELARGGAPLPEGASVLDIGCGTGRHAARIAASGRLVLGVDRAPRMVRAAAAKARARGLEGRVGFVRGDALRLPVRAARFDLAISLCEGAFGASERPEGDLRLLREARRALRPGGALVLVALHRPWLDRQGEWRYDPARGRNVGREWHTFEDGRRRKVEISTRAYRVEEAAALLERAGLEVVARLGARPGEYGAVPLDGDAMQYLLVARRPARRRSPREGAERAEGAGRAAARGARPRAESERREGHVGRRA